MGQMGIGADQAAGEVYMLRKIIEEFNKQTNEQTRQMIRLTKIIAWLTVAMAFGVVVQIVVAIMQ